jgi:predicted nucleic acid-binding protein
MKWLRLLGLFPCLVWAGGNTPDWPASWKGVESGEQAWIDKVPELAARADVKQAAGLEDALSMALSKNTSAVLGALSIIDANEWPHMIGTDIVCGIPAELFTTDAMVEDFYQRTRLALLKTDKGATCLWILEATYEEWKADNARKAK